MPTVLTERSVFITPVWLHTLILSGCQFQSLLEDIYYFLPTASGGQHTDGVLHKYQYLCLKMTDCFKRRRSCVALALLSRSFRLSAGQLDKNSAEQSDRQPLNE